MEEAIAWFVILIVFLGVLAVLGAIADWLEDK